MRNHRFFTRCLLRGEIGLGEAFVNEDWESDDVVEVVRLLAPGGSLVLQVITIPDAHYQRY